MVTKEEIETRLNQKKKYNMVIVEQLAVQPGVTLEIKESDMVVISHPDLNGGKEMRAALANRDSLWHIFEAVIFANNHIRVGRRPE